MDDKIKIEELSKKLDSELRKLAKDIHANPEMGMEEFQACKWQIQLLEKYGFQIEENFCDLPTSFKASYKGKKNGPSIAFLSEYDALPELGHGCGHNLIATLAVGCGIMAKEFADLYGGEIYVVGTPAEETAGTKVPMAKMGVFDNFDVVMMGHPAFMNADSMNTMAILARKIEFFGKTAHAAAAPETGINALDAMINFYNLVNAMRQQITPDARIHGVITNGGTAANIIPDYTAASFYIRANRAGEAIELVERVKACAEGAAKGTGCTFKMSPSEEDFMDTKSNEVLNALAADYIDMFTEEKLNRLHGQYIPGSSDLGDVSYRCPSVQMVFKIGEDENPMGQHTEKFEKCAGTDKAIDNTFNFMKGLVMTAIDIMKNPDTLKKIKMEFEETTKNNL